MQAAGPLFRAVLALLICLTIGSGIQAGSATDNRLTSSPFPGFGKVCGQRLVWEVVPQLALARRAVNGEPLIVLDKSLAREENAFHLAYLSAHECAHHRLGHLNRPALAQRGRDRRVVLDQELSADCMATEMLIRAGRKRDIIIMLERFKRAGFASPGRGYPSGLQRAQILVQCAEAERPGSSIPSPSD